MVSRRLLPITGPLVIRPWLWSRPCRLGGWVRAGDRQLKDPRYGLTHNLGGFPFQNVAAISVVGRYDKKG